MLRGSFNIVTIVLLLLTGVTAAASFFIVHQPQATFAVVLGGLCLSALPRIIREWERGVLLRLGRFQGVLEPGIAWVIPGADCLVSMVDMRIRSTSFSSRGRARRTLALAVPRVSSERLAKEPRRARQQHETRPG